MRKTIRLIAVIICLSLLLLQVAFAMDNSMVIENEFTTYDGDSRIEVATIDDTVYYLEDGSESTISLAIYPDGNIEYHVVNKDQSDVIYSAVAHTSDISAYNSNDDFDIIKAHFDDVEMESSAAISVVPQTNEASISSESSMMASAVTGEADDARAAAIAYFGTPYGPNYLKVSTIPGSGTIVYLLSFLSYSSAYHANSIQNIIGSTVAKIAASLALGVATLVSIVRTVLIAGVRYIADGAFLKRYEVTAMETKVVEIEGGSWYNSGRDTIVLVMVGDIGVTVYGTTLSWQNSDFTDNNYLWQKGVNNYLGVW